MSGLSFGVPRIVAIVEERLLSQEGLRELQKKGVTLIELRMESLSCPLSEIVDFARLAQSDKGFGLIATVRLRSQSQKFQERREDDPTKASELSMRADLKKGGGRLKLFEALAPYADIIDLELETEEEEKKALLSLARRQNCQLLLSDHNFSFTPEVKEMQLALEEARSCGADFLKLAYYTKNQNELGLLFQFAFKYHRERKEGDPRLVWIGMGPWGLISRVLSSFTGSPFSYAFLERPNAPGQFSVDQLHQEFLRYHPAYCK